MRPAPLPSDPDPVRADLRRRAIAVVLTIVAHALLLLMLLRLAPEQFGLPAGPRVTTVSLLPEAEQASETSTTDRARRRRNAAAPAEPAPRPTPPAEQQPPPPPVPLPARPLDILQLSREDMAMADISRLPHTPGQSAAQGAATGDEADDGSDGGPQQTFRGERLYNAQWYREPTDAELGFYLPKNGPRLGWALIACRTAERFHVEDCQELGDSPPGSGFARAITAAAWQFLVRPPRQGGKSLIGAWVRIRIDFTERGAR